MAVTTVRWRFSVADYDRMREAGILTEDDRVELIEGEVRVMSPIGPCHAALVKRLNALLSRLADSAIVSVQDPIRLSDDSEPQPDLAVLCPRHDFYAQALPTPADVLLVIEIADTSVDYDRDEKIPLYAEAGIPEAWLIDATNDTIEQYTRPTGGQYREQQTLERGQTVTSQSVSKLKLRVNTIFG